MRSAAGRYSSFGEYLLDIYVNLHICFLVFTSLYANTTGDGYPAPSISN